ncbi:hypothetical protein G7Y89_g9424 [Cudoniella acicularis]|uniref:Uncharacterized protein n=1 Tax=Cudoniella acicularis TaxID=354080 RepID=A0A8H4REP2_9HELO|nr:hypothetical protein G7Y89_g9424 [Cudoniella acicularis]
MTDINPSAPAAPRYRPAKPVTEEIRQHCHIYLDEQLYTHALTLLSDLITAGASHPDCQNIPVIAPIPYHIELVCCLLIHPRYTTQAPPSERLELPARSITLLRNILAILGPINANLDQAFSLEPEVTSRNLRRGRNTTEHDDESSGNDSDDKSERMRGVIANKGRIRRCAKDFWHMVGWALNCSVKYPKRWQYWKVWLDYMLDVLDADYKERKRQDEEIDSVKSHCPDSEAEFILLRECLLLKYLSDVRGRSSAVKRVVRSIFADGGPENLKEFPEVFENETKEVKFQNGQKRKREGTAIQKFGDYEEDDANLEFETARNTDRSSETIPDDEEENTLFQDPYLGGPDSIALRQRLLALLSRLSDDLPEEFVDVRDAYDIFFTSVRSLPVPAFSLFISPSISSQLPEMVLVSLSQLLLLRLLPNNAPRPHTIRGRDNDEITQELLEQCFLPFSANTSSVEDNAKVSILVESLFRLYVRSCLCDHTLDLDHAIEKGILARQNKVKGDKRRKETTKKKGEDSDMMWLNASGERLRLLLEWIERKTTEE